MNTNKQTNSWLYSHIGTNSPFKRRSKMFRNLKNVANVAKVSRVRWASTSPNFIVLGDSSNLKGIVDSADSKVLYFTATWCPPCKMIAPVFEKLSKDFPKTKFVKIDIDDHNDTAAEYGIRSVPTFMFFKGSNLTNQVIVKILGQ